MERYRCDMCGDQCCSPSDWTESDARAEFEQTFGHPTPEDAAVLCDDCYRELKAKLRAS